MSVKVTVTEQPGLLAMLDEDTPVSSGAIVAAMDDFLSTPGIAGSKVEADLRSTLRSQAKTTGETFGPWEAIKRWWERETHVAVAAEQQRIELAAYWLTLPAVPGATVSVTSSVSKSQKVSGSVSIAGIGGGPTFTVDLEEGVYFEATAPERAFLTAIATFDKIEVRKGGKPTTAFARLRKIDRDRQKWTRRRENPPDPAELGRPTGTKEFEFVDGSGSSKRRLAVAAGESWSLGASLNLPQLGLDVGLRSEFSVKREVVYEHFLPLGFDYVATRYESFPAYLWTAKP